MIPLLSSSCFIRKKQFINLTTNKKTQQPAAAQFGIPNRKKGAGSFEEMNELAKNQAAGAGGAGGGGDPMAGLNLDALKGMDADALSKMMEQAMADPALKEQMNTMQAGMADAMEQLSSMSPEDLQKQMMEGLAQLTSGDIMDTVMGQKDEVLETLAAQGMVPKEKLEEYRNNPELVSLSFASQLVYDALLVGGRKLEFRLCRAGGRR